jgi:hypothetical protein
MYRGCILGDCDRRAAPAGRGHRSPRTHPGGEPRMIIPAGGERGRIAGHWAFLLGSHIVNHGLGTSCAAELGFVPGEPDTIRGGDVLPGLELRVRDVFHWPGEADRSQSPSDWRIAWHRGCAGRGTPRGGVRAARGRALRRPRHRTLRRREAGRRRRALRPHRTGRPAHQQRRRHSPSFPSHAPGSPWRLTRIDETS